MDIPVWIGYIAGTCSTLAFVPQVFRTFKTKSADDISWGMLLLLTAGVSLWFLYGIGIEEIPVIVANGITLLLLTVMSCMKYVYEKRSSGNMIPVLSRD
ncbi:MAG TPA: SemiSWEET transporter [Methanospirillum sp.]|nr:SemiSWEET transporter [Methanospirillum sp.]